MPAPFVSSKVVSRSRPEVTAARTTSGLDGRERLCLCCAEAAGLGFCSTSSWGPSATAAPCSMVLARWAPALGMQPAERSLWPGERPSDVPEIHRRRGLSHGMALHEDSAGGDRAGFRTAAAVWCMALTDLQSLELEPRKPMRPSCCVMWHLRSSSLCQDTENCASTTLDTAVSHYEIKVRILADERVHDTSMSLA